MLNSILYILPKRALSRWVGFLVHLELPDFLRVSTLKWFAGRYRLNLDEAEHPIEHYKSIGDLFVRRLKPGLRPIGTADLVHPADSRITQQGPLNGGELIQAKGMTYKLDDFWAHFRLSPTVRACLRPTTFARRITIACTVP